MAYKEGDYVRHGERPTWGVGRIGRVMGEKVEIHFQDQVRLLDMSIAGPHLQRSSGDEYQGSATPTSAKRASRAKKTAK